MAWKWGRGKRENQGEAAREDAVLAELAVQQEAMNGLSIAEFLAGVSDHQRRAADPPSVARDRRRAAVRRHRIESLVSTGVVDSDAAGVLVDDELAAGDALLLDGDAWGRWPEQSPVTRAAEQTRGAAAQLPEEALAAVKINVSLVPQEDGR